MPLTLPQVPETPNVRQLAQWKQQEFTGLATATIPLAQTPDAQSGLLLAWLNGTLLRPSLLTLSGQTLTLPAALVSGDWLVVFYKSRI